MSEQEKQSTEKTPFPQLTDREKDPVPPAYRP